jgi:hypothetical protein
MPEKITWSLNVQIQGGPKLASSQALEVDAYDVIEVVVTGHTEQEVNVQPGVADHVSFLSIGSDRYHKSQLTYKPKDGTGPGTASVNLDAQQLFLGAGAVALLEKAPQQLVFKNDMGEDATIQILVGRKVTA